MEKKITIGRWEAVSMLLILICTQIFLNFPRLMAESAGNAGWILVIYVTCVTVILFFIISKLYEKFEGKDLLDISEHIAGSPGKIVIGSFLTLYLLFIISVVLREFSEDMKVISLNISPISFVSLFFITGMIIGAYTGLESLARLSVIVVPLIIIGILVIGAGVSQYDDFTRLMPILGTGPYDLFVNGLSKVSIYSAILILYFLSPYLKTKKNFNRVGYTSILLASFFLIISTIVYFLAFPFPNTTEYFLPIYQMARMINYGRFFQRLESIFLLIWAASAQLYLAIGFFFILSIFRKTFKLKYYKPLILPFAVIVFTLSLIPQNLMTVIFLETNFFRNLAWSVVFVLTILLLLTARIINKGSKGEKKSDEKV